MMDRVCCFIVDLLSCFVFVGMRTGVGYGPLIDYSQPLNTNPAPLRIEDRAHPLWVVSWMFEGVHALSTECMGTRE
jgi:hypothetical protein